MRRDKVPYLSSESFPNLDSGSWGTPSLSTESPVELGSWLVWEVGRRLLQGRLVIDDRVMKNRG